MTARGADISSAGEGRIMPNANKTRHGGRVAVKTTILQTSFMDSPLVDKTTCTCTVVASIRMSFAMCYVYCRLIRMLPYV